MKYTDRQLDEIDRLVAEHVMGWKWSSQLLCWYPEGGTLADSRGKRQWQPTRSGDAMLDVVEKMRADGWQYDLCSHGKALHIAYFHHGEEIDDSPPDGAVRQRTLPLAVALAALAAVGHPYKEQGNG